MGIQWEIEYIMSQSDDSSLFLSRTTFTHISHMNIDRLWNWCHYEVLGKYLCVTICGGASICDHNHLRSQCKTAWKVRPEAGSWLRTEVERTCNRGERDKRRERGQPEREERENEWRGRKREILMLIAKLLLEKSILTHINAHWFFVLCWSGEKFTNMQIYDKSRARSLFVLIKLPVRRHFALNFSSEPFLGGLRWSWLIRSSKHYKLISLDQVYGALS
jgi:hypothetical protein